MTQNQDIKEIDLFDLVFFFVRHWKMILSTTFAFLFLGLFLSFSQPQYYNSTAVIELGYFMPNGSMRDMDNAQHRFYVEDPDLFVAKAQVQNEREKDEYPYFSTISARYNLIEIAKKGKNKDRTEKLLQDFLDKNLPRLKTLEARMSERLQSGPVVETTQIEKITTKTDETDHGIIFGFLGFLAGSFIAFIKEGIKKGREVYKQRYAD